MRKLQIVSSLLIGITIAIPILLGGLIFYETFQIKDAYTRLGVISRIHRVFSDAKKLDDAQLAKASAEREKVPDGDLQMKMSDWIQAHAEGKESLIDLRTRELATMMKQLESQNEQMIRASWARVQFTGGLLALLALAAGVAMSQFLKRQVFMRLWPLQREMEGFRLMDYQLSFNRDTRDDEIGDLNRAFGIMLHNILEELNFNLGLQEGAQGTSQANDHTMLEQVKTYLIERRAERDRRKQNQPVAFDRRQGDRRADEDGIVDRDATDPALPQNQTEKKRA